MYNVKDEVLYIECACIDGEHLITLRRFVEKIDDDDREIYMSYYLSDHKGILKRTWDALKYMLGYQNEDGNFGGTMILAEELEKVIDYLQAALKAWHIEKNTISMGNKFKTYYIECGRCSHGGPTIRWSREKHEDEWDRDIYVSYHLDINKHFFKRVWGGIKYVFGFRSIYGDFGSTQLNIADVEKLIRFFQSALEEWQIMDARGNENEI
jgi:hypothetical protein